MIADIEDYEGAAGDVDAEERGPIFIMRRSTGADAVRATLVIRNRVLEFTAVEVLEHSLDHNDVVTLLAQVYLFDFVDDYYRGEADRMTLSWADGSRQLDLPYPTAPS